MKAKTIPPVTGVGVGLRSVHYEYVLSRRPAVPWFEATSENYMGLRGGSGGPPSGRASPPVLGGRPLEMLERVRRDYPVALHGVSLNIGSADPLNRDYLTRLKSLADRIRPLWLSDHLCWTGVGGQNLHDLLPLPLTEETLRHLAGRVRKVQEFLGRRVLLENVSSYLTYAHSEMTEWEFLSELARRADCGLLLDVNNIHVSAVNQGFNPLDYLNGVPADRVGYMHLAGPSEADGFLIDTHDHPVPGPVWELFAAAAARFPKAPALIEWDDKIPPFPRLLAEAAKAEKIQTRVRKNVHVLAAAG